MAEQLEAEKAALYGRAVTEEDVEAERVAAGEDATDVAGVVATDKTSEVWQDLHLRRTTQLKPR